ncbi:MAG: PAS domain S-box protein, partial [Phormidesmis sp.]
MTEAEGAARLASDDLGSDRPRPASTDPASTDLALSDHRLKTLHRLFANTAKASLIEPVTQAIGSALSTNLQDIPFALLYLPAKESAKAATEDATEAVKEAAKEGSTQVELALSVGIEPKTAVSPMRLDLDQNSVIWPFKKVSQAKQSEVVSHLGEALSGLTASGDKPPSAARVMPLSLPGQQPSTIFLVLGINPQQPFDDDYRDFFDLIASQVLHSIADAIDYEAQQKLQKARQAATENERSLRLSVEHSQQQVDTILESISDAFVSFDYQWRYTYVNNKATQLLQKSRAELIGKHIWEDVFPERIGAPVYTELQRVMREQQPAVFEIFDPTIEVWVEAHAYPTEDEVAVYFHDITDRKNSEFQLQQSEARLRETTVQLEAALEAGAVYTWRWDIASDRLIVNAPFAQLFAVDTDLATTVGLPLEDFIASIHADDRADVAARVERAIATGADYSAEYRVHTASGEERWLTARGKVMYDFAGQPISFPGAIVDITERKRTEVILREKEQTLSAVFDQAFQLIGQLTPQGIVLNVNQIVLQLVGASKESICGQYFWDTPWWSHDTALQAKLRRSIAQANQGEFIRYEADFPGSNGDLITIDFSLKPVMNDAGEVMLLIAEGRDITERKQIEAERDGLLQEAQAAREVAEAANRVKDEFLAVVSHELRTPLNPILGWSQMLRKRQLGPEKVDYALATIERNARIQAQLINDLLDVSRILRGKLSLEAMPVDLVSVIDMAAETVWLAAAAKSIQIEADLDPSVGPISGDASRLQQVIWNLLSNAIKFTPDGGRATIRLTQVENRAKITVSDT